MPRDTEIMFQGASSELQVPTPALLCPQYTRMNLMLDTHTPRGNCWVWVGQGDAFVLPERQEVELGQADRVTAPLAHRSLTGPGRV